MCINCFAVLLVKSISPIYLLYSGTPYLSPSITSSKIPSTLSSVLNNNRIRCIINTSKSLTPHNNSYHPFNKGSPCFTNTHTHTHTHTHTSLITNNISHHSIGKKDPTVTPAPTIAQLRTIIMSLNQQNIPLRHQHISQPSPSQSKQKHNRHHLTHAYHACTCCTIYIRKNLTPHTLCMC